MRQVIREYGRGLIAVFAVGIIFSLIFSSALGVGNRGIFDTLPKVFAAANDENNDMDVADEFSNEAYGRSVPLIRSEPVCKINKTYSLINMFTDENGEKFDSVRLLEISRMENGETRPPSVAEAAYDEKSVRFMSAGLYRVRVAVTDSEGVVNSASFYIGAEI